MDTFFIALAKYLKNIIVYGTLVGAVALTCITIGINFNKYGTPYPLDIVTKMTDFWMNHQHLLIYSVFITPLTEIFLTVIFFVSTFSEKNRTDEDILDSFLASLFMGVIFLFLIFAMFKLIVLLIY